MENINHIIRKKLKLLKKSEYTLESLYELIHENGERCFEAKFSNINQIIEDIHDKVLEVYIREKPETIEYGKQIYTIKAKIMSNKDTGRTELAV